MPAHSLATPAPLLPNPLSVVPDPSLSGFHPVIQRWFADVLGDPTAPQKLGWPLISEGKNVLIAAPTGSGKTLSAFLSVLDELFRLALTGELADETRVIYISPLKALGNDVQKNLLAPLEEIYKRALAEGLNPQPLRVLVRTGDTKASERASMVKKPPHVLITTPESLYLYLTAPRARQTLKSARTVVVDEIHALARDKRGSHFTLSMERLKSLCESIQCIGLSATQKPLDALAAFLVGLDENGQVKPCELVQVGHLRPLEVKVETPEDELSSAATHEMWGQTYDRLELLTRQHRTMLVFANTRRLAERVAHDLGERIGHERVAAHHGSMARELRLAAEERLKSGQLSVMVATASLELGIDIGSVDMVVQLGSPRSIAVALQRVGRAGHHKLGISRGILFAMTRDELVESAALKKAILEGELDAVRMPVKPLDVLAQQVVAELSAQEWNENDLFALVRRASPYRTLTREEFDKVLVMLSEGVATSRGRSRVHLHWDRVNGLLRARKGSGISAMTNAGAIPDTFSYPVVAEPEDKVVGTLDEDFAVESMAGDVFLLGSTSWRVRSVRGGTVRVEDANGQAPSVPFWRGEAPSRTDELSTYVAKLRDELLTRGDGLEYLERTLELDAPTASQLHAYVRAGAAALGGVPSDRMVIAERFFDEAGGMQLIIHAPFGGRINRAWGLSLRKRFCRTFDFELQAAATDDGIILSLGEQHSFPLMEIFDFLSPENVEEVLVQAILQTPLFGTRFRWNATRALALSRFSMGRKVPPQIQRARSDDLLAAVFPAQVGCQDNHGGADVELPDHPLVNETIDNCLREAMDVDGLREVLRGLKSGRIAKRAVDLPEPSVFAHQMLNSAPYTYLDDAPLEERRARAVSVRRTLPPADAAAFGALDTHAIEEVVRDAQPVVRDEDELHDALLQLMMAPVGSGLLHYQPEWLETLIAGRRATLARTRVGDFLVAAERVRAVRTLLLESEQVLQPDLPALPHEKELSRDDAAFGLVRGWVEVMGPTTSVELAERIPLSVSDIDQVLFRLESVGQVLRGTFRPLAQVPPGSVEWCDRRLLQRIHRMTVARLRSEIQPLSAQDFMRFLFRWHHIEEDDNLRGPQGLLKAVTLLQGYEAPAAAWEQALFPTRMKQYLPELLERLCFGGEVAWGRLTLRESRAPLGARRGSGPQVIQEPIKTPRPTVGRAACITFCRREDFDWLTAVARPASSVLDVESAELSPGAKDVASVLKRRGASFFAELVSGSRRLPAEVEDALWELLACGHVTADAVENLRVLQSPKARRRQKALRRGGPGRWSLLSMAEPFGHEELVKKSAGLLLARYGIVWRDLLARECMDIPWRELLFEFRRMEARGEVRGGRFVAGFAGEQFALHDAVDMARSVRRVPPKGVVVHLSATDPLNLTGVVTPGPRVAAMLGQVVTYVDGVPR